MKQIAGKHKLFKKSILSFKRVAVPRGIRANSYVVHKRKRHFYLMPSGIKYPAPCSHQTLEGQVDDMDSISATYILIRDYNKCCGVGAAFFG